VLENLWLERRDEHYLFFKGLIQVAGLCASPEAIPASHASEAWAAAAPGRAALSTGDDEPRDLRARHLQLDVAAVLRLCEQQAAEIVAGTTSAIPGSRPTRRSCIFSPRERGTDFHD